MQSEPILDCHAKEVERKGRHKLGHVAGHEGGQTHSCVLHGTHVAGSERKLVLRRRIEG